MALSRFDIVAEMRAAGLPRPRVIPTKLRDGSVVFDLYCGEDGSRVTHRLSRDPSDAALASAIQDLKARS